MNIEKILQAIKELIAAFAPKPQVQPQWQPPLATTTPPIIVKPTPMIDIEHSDIMYPDWIGTKHARHNARVLMDLAGLNVHEKDLLCAVIMAESGFDIKAVNHNTNGSSDHGIVQMNTTYWIGPGKLFKNIQEVYDNPTKSVQFMIDAYKDKHLGWWYGYTNKSYLRYL